MSEVLADEAFPEHVVIVLLVVFASARARVSIQSTLCTRRAVGAPRLQRNDRAYQHVNLT